METEIRPPEGRASTRTSGRILLVLPEDSLPTMALRRTVELAPALGLEVSLLRVLRRPAAHAFGSRIDVSEAVQLVERMRIAIRSTRRWLDDTLGDAVPQGQLYVRLGELVDEVTAHAVGIGAELIVLPPVERLGTTATALARSSRLAVLVPRRRASREVILAATDLRDDEYPVLRRAAEWAHRFDAPVVALHNVNPVSLMSGFGGMLPLTMGLNAEVARSRRQRLARASKALRLEGLSVVLADVSAVDAILREARSRDANMIVVGTRARTWMGWLVAQAVASHVVERARRSVLVTPLDAEPFLAA